MSVHRTIAPRGVAPHVFQQNTPPPPFHHTQQQRPAAAPRRALVSVSDKTGLADLAKGLAALGYELASTGGSAAAIEAAGVPVKKVEALTGFPEMLDGAFLWRWIGWWIARQFVCLLLYFACNALLAQPSELA
jgi:hypothetical protein